MNFKKFLLTLFCLSQFCTAYSQGFAIERTDVSAFPSVTIRIRNTSGKALEKTAITLNENSTHIRDFNLSIAATTDTPGSNDQVMTEPSGGAVLFLIENGAFTSAQQIAAVKNAIAGVLRNTHNDMAANVCYFNRTRPGGAMSRISSDFTTDYPILITDMNRRVMHVAETQPGTDLYKALYECIEYMAGKNSITSPKQIILIATGEHNGTSPITQRDCAELAAKSSITVNGIGLRSANINATDNVKIAAQNMSGHYESGSSAADIERSIQEFITIGKVDEKQSAANDDNPSGNSGAVYNIVYNSLAAAGDEVQLLIAIAGANQNAVFTAPEGAKSKKGWDNSIYYLIAGILLIGAILASILLAHRARKKRAQEELEAQQVRETEQRRVAAEADVQRREEAARTAMQQAVQQPTQFVQQQQPAAANDPHRTVVGGTKMPQLFVTAGENTQTYNLTGHPMSIGRDAGNEVIVNSPNVSRRHAAIALENGQWYITDTGSTNGVFVDGQRVQKHALVTGVQILLGDAVCSFVL